MLGRSQNILVMTSATAVTGVRRAFVGANVEVTNSTFNFKMLLMTEVMSRAEF